ncbi:hypothetical protein POM88_036916 [Heracleum sosnowskyi]|uniref:Uncharacterized protein n=1 Tax=Heracleum sosnowskyi TaxID=360622 RepID=A0AAD8HPA4_9APIA|nr:hypothetical protein POM88_036916 [Heracleum sosnowskyi]
MGIRKSLHPIKSVDGEKYEIMAAIFDMTNKEKEVFFKVLKNVKMPYGCASNVSRYVHTNERKVVGYKSHDAHFILHYLLQFAAKKSLKPEVAKPLIRLSAFLREISEYHIGTRRNKDGKVFQLKDSDWKACHTYTLFNCDNKEIETLFEEHRTLVDVSAKEPVKRTFVTAHQLQLQQQKKNGKIPRSPQLEKCPPVNGYELGRLRRVQENKEKFKELGLGKYAANPNLPNVKESKRKKKDGEESDEYIVENESGDDSDDSSELMLTSYKIYRIKTVKEKKTVPGPRTRSRANATDLGDKDPAHAIEKRGKKVAPSRNYATLLKPTCSKLLNQGDKSVQSGTIAAYIALRESQRKDLEGDRRICDVLGFIVKTQRKQS